jgi:hypothetical protein
LRGRFRDVVTREGNFRYAAGFLGWGHPEIQSRLARLAHDEMAFDEAARREVVAIREETARGPATVGDAKVHLALASGGVLSVRVEAAAGYDCRPLQATLDRLAIVDEAGRFEAVPVVLHAADGRACEPERKDLAPPAPPLRGTVSLGVRATHVRLVRLPDGHFARAD